MEWSTLTSALYDLKKLEFEIMLLAEKEKDQKAGAKVDQAKLNVSNDVKLLQGKIAALDREIKELPNV
jgi:hypothetical protein